MDGSRPVEGPKEIFGGNASDEEFAEVSAQNFIPKDFAQFFFTPSLVNTGSEIVLFDTGLGKGGIQNALAQAGVTPDAVDVVVLTHMHPDHIGGLMTESAATFPNARYVTGSTEYDFWAATEEGRRFAFHAPLMHLSKKEIIERGTTLGVDYTTTHSCYDPDEQGRACGLCDACRLRLKGFAEAGLHDPIAYKAVEKD